MKKAPIKLCNGEGRCFHTVPFGGCDQKDTGRRCKALSGVYPNRVVRLTHHRLFDSQRILQK